MSTSNRKSAMGWVLGLFLFGAAAPGMLAAQVPPATDPPTAEEPAGAAESEEDAPATAPAGPPDYIFPDLPALTLVYDGEHFLFKPIFAMVGDFTTFDQDDASLAQVGEQEDTQEVRAARLGFYLRSKGNFAWDFYFTSDYQERNDREKTVFQIFDMKVGIPLGQTKLTIGKQKQPFSYELLALSVILPHQERILSPFFVTRSIGAQLSGLLAGDRMTWAAGVFNDWLDTDLEREENGTDYAGRLTGLVYESPSRTDYLHFGLGLRRVGADDGVLRFSGRPESNVADKYVDTGNFAGDHADELLVELLWSHRQFSLLAERVEAHVDAPASGDPRFSGYYGTASWILTGESRPYVRASGYAGGLSPLRRWGALEFALRYSHLDLTDGAIDGGELDKWSYNLSWWASAQWKIGLTYGDADLDRSGLTGNTKMWLARIQWLY